MVGGSGAKAVIVAAIEAGTYIPSPHGDGSSDHIQATRITPSEAGVLQSFPSNYEWRGGKSAIGTQIGNCIPPLLATAILKGVLNDEG